MTAAIPRPERKNRNRRSRSSGTAPQTAASMASGMICLGWVIEG